MPYIKLVDRVVYEIAVSSLPLTMTAGELNYFITRIILRFLGPEPHYENLNAAMGVLEAVKHEMYRRLAAPYEDKKREEHGDVY